MLPDNLILCQDINRDLEKVLSELDFTRLMVLVDENTHELCYPLIHNSLPEHRLIHINAGEEYKNLGTCSSIWEALTNYHCDRHSLMINLGGGVIAATYKRGIRFINLPTTLLAQVDASLGGKLGIDFQGFKNHIGVFQEPEKVIVSPGFLDTLPSREVRSGFAEIIKHALIADGSYWRQIVLNDLEDQEWESHIQHSIEVKNDIVVKDPREKGLRKLLNFGHTLGHAVETYFLSRPGEKLLHGEAIAVGMIAEAYLSRKKCGLKQDELLDIKSYLLDIFGHPILPEEATEPVLSYVMQDKKNSGSTINCTLLENIGLALFDIPVTAEEIHEAFAFYNS